MLRKIQLFIFSILFGNFGFNQLNTYEAIVDSLLIAQPVSGFMWFDTTLIFAPGMAFTIYQNQTNDIDNNLILEKAWVDPQIGAHHYKYNQTFKNIKVEGAGYTEHFRSQKLVLINGKLAYALNPNTTPKINAGQALQTALDDFPSTTVFAWNVQAMEDDLQDALNDSNATYAPSIELIYALDKYYHIGHLIPGNRYKLAYKFDVSGAADEFNFEFVIDANSDEIIRKTSNFKHNGLATVYNSTGGTQTIDTRYRSWWLFDDHVLQTDNDGREVHTKYYGAGIFSTASEIDDDDDTWTGFATWATTAHWYASESWDYFMINHQQDGMDGQGGNVRVFAKRTANDHTNTHYSPATDKMTFTYVSVDNSHTGNSPGIVGHEFTHGVIRHSVADFANGGEPGALEESFCDIFGTLIRKQTISSSLYFTVHPWRMGYCGEPDVADRSLSDPNSAGRHMASFTAGSPDVCVSGTGQPDTYKGLHWLHLDQDYCNDWGECSYQ